MFWAKKVEDVAAQADEATTIAHNTANAADSMARAAQGLQNLVSRFRNYRAYASAAPAKSLETDENAVVAYDSEDHQINAWPENFMRG